LLLRTPRRGRSFVSGLTHRPFRIWHCLCAHDRYGGVHSSSAGSRVSELTDTPNLASSYCPRCEPERDPVHEILTVCWCDEHRPTCEGADDERAIVGGGVLVSVGEVNAATNRLWCELLHRTLNRSKRARQSRPRSRTPRTSTGLRLITESAAPRRPEMETGECDRGEEGRRSTA